jgi:YesN/AraC family two-component response regulator
MIAVSLAIAWGCREFLSKPVGKDELLAVVRKWSYSGKQTQIEI